MSKLALLGGNPVIEGTLAPYPSMGEAERRAVAAVVESGCLSGFYGSPGPEFLGGSRVIALEQAWAERFGCRHAISVNSATSGLFAAMGAIGIGPGDEVIVPPWTMSATAMAPLIYGGIPVFADIEDQTFCIDPARVRDAITPKTRAILAVNLFGHPARLHELRGIADEHGLSLVEDNAQAPLASEDDVPCGTIGHIGVFSLNTHKHIHSGEGGMCTTNDDRLAERLALIRNHGENLMDGRSDDALVNMVGFNFRMTELIAAVALEQLKRIDVHVSARERLAQALSDGTRDLCGWRTPAVRGGCRHNHYCWVVRFDAAAVGVSRETFSRALTAEGFPHATGYVKPLYLLPLFQRRRAVGHLGFPFSLTNATYPPGLCAVVERLHAREAILLETCAYDMTDGLAERLVEAIRKVHAGRGELVALDRQAVVGAD